MTRHVTPADIQGQVVAMYESHPFPSYADKFRKTAEEMHLKMRLLGISEAEYKNRRILDCGCGTGEFSCWYAAQGSRVTAVDLSDPSLEHAREYADQYGLSDRVEFVKMSVLDLDFPDDTFDLVYSYGVLHHTPDPLRGLDNMVRVCKPGGVVVVSVYSRYSRLIHRQKQKLINRIAGDDIEKRYKWGKRLFPLTARKLKLRAHDASDAILYDQFSSPHESLHTVSEVLGWLDKHGLDYLGAFGPLRVRDYLYAASIPEYERLEKTFEGYLAAQMVSRGLKGMSRVLGFRPQESRKFQRPSRLSQLMVQTGWFLFGLRFSCFSIAGRKPPKGD